MSAVAVWMLAVGVADLLAATAATRTPARKPVLPSLGLVVVALVGGVASGLSPLAVAVLAVVTAVSGGAWLWLRHADAEPAALAVLAAAVTLLLATAGVWSPRTDVLSAALAWSALAAVTPPDLVLLVVGVATFLVATGNGIVRILLRRVETDILSQEDHLKGGRVIGPLERLLIFGLGISGQLTAAGLVVAAKSLLRFGELRHYEDEIAAGQRPVPRRAELMSEYLLVGSLLSWTLALAAVALVALARAGP